MISSENKQKIAAEISALGAAEQIPSALEVIEVAATRFVQSREGVSNRQQTPRAETILSQIEKVERNKGGRFRLALKKALEMNVRTTPENILAGSAGLGRDRNRGHASPGLFFDAKRDLECGQETYVRYPEIFDNPDSNRSCPHQRRFFVQILSVWRTAGGAIKFTDPKSHENGGGDGGALGRFLIASISDAYTAVGRRIPTGSGLKTLSKSLERRVDFYISGVLQHIDDDEGPGDDWLDLTIDEFLAITADPFD